MNGSAVTGLFIMLSGFMMCFAYTDASGRMRTSARELRVGRVARLWPIMMIGHLMAAPFAFAGTDQYGAAEASRGSGSPTRAFGASCPRSHARCAAARLPDALEPRAAAT